MNRIIRGNEICVGVLHPHRSEVFSDRKMQGVFEKAGEIGRSHGDLGSQFVQGQGFPIVLVDVGRHRAEPVIVAVFLSWGGAFCRTGEGGAEKIDQLINKA